MRGMRLGWYSELTSVERRAYWACFAGFGLDSMDTTIYALVIPSLIADIGLTRPEAGYLSTAALLGTGVGGWGAGILADRIGRVRVLQLTILWVAVFTFAAAFCNSFSQLFCIRFLQGLGYGGEAAVGGVLISEVIRPALRGRVAASIQSGYAVGMRSQLRYCRLSPPCFRRPSAGVYSSPSASCRHLWFSSSVASFPSPACTPTRRQRAPAERPQRRFGRFLPLFTYGALRPPS